MQVAPIGTSEGGGDALLSFASPSNGVAARVVAVFAQHDRGEMEVLFALLAERYERRSVAITSNEDRTLPIQPSTTGCRDTRPTKCNVASRVSCLWDMKV